MADEPILVVIDETGTTNHPSLHDADDFAVGAIVFSASDVEHLTRTSKAIGKLLQENDYKYKDVQRLSEARGLFLSAMNKLQQPAGVYGFYAPGKGIAEETRKTLEVVRRKNLNDHAELEAVEALKSAPRQQLMKEFLGPMTSSFTNYAHGWKREAHIYWDRRNDLATIGEHSISFDQITQSILSHLKNEPSRSARFMGEAPREFVPIARLGGVVAGDVLMYFRKHGPRIWAKLIEGFDINPADPRLDNFSVGGIFQTTKVATVCEQLADNDTHQGSRDTCMIQGYYKRFISNLISFYSPTGSMGHVCVERGDRWHVHQNPN